MTTRQAEKARTRQRYLAEAARLFSQRGFHAVSIAEVGAAVGVSGPALYRHFDSKDDVLAQILLDASQRLVAGLEEIRARWVGSSAELLEALVDFHLDFALSSRAVIRLQDRELANLAPEHNRRVRQLQRHYIDTWATITSEVRPELTIDACRVLMHAVFGILNSTAHNEALAPFAVTREVLRSAALAALGTGSSR